MSEQALHSFLSQMLADGQLRSEAAAALAAVATRRGFECSPADCERLFKTTSGTEDGELSDDALAAVSGGVGAPVIGHSISVSFSQQSDGLGAKFKTGQ